MLEHNRDRGKIKWTAMMLPEHISLLREWQQEDDYIPKPDLTDFDLQDIQEQLNSAMLSKCIALVKTWKEGKVTSYQGTIEEIDIHKQRVKLEDPFGIVLIPADEIVLIQHTN